MSTSNTSSRAGRPLRPLPTLALAICALSAALPQGVCAQVITTGTPTAAEQLALELINRARANPVVETTRLNAWGQSRGIIFTPMASYTEGITSTGVLATMPATGSPPLAFNPNLQGLAQNYGLAQLNNNVNPTSHFYAYPESLLGPRERAWGYMADQGKVQENIKTTYRLNNGTNTPLQADASRVASDYFYLFLDAGVSGRGHRVNLLTSTFTEVGIGYARDDSYQPAGHANTYFALMMTQDFGYRSSAPSFLTGVVYNDGFASDNDFYDIGEGLGGVTINVYNPGTRVLRGSTTTWGSGGYSLALPFGTYDVEFVRGTTVQTKSTAGWSGMINFKLDADIQTGAQGFIPQYPSIGDVEEIIPEVPTAVEAVPEASTSALMAMGLLGLLGLRAGSRKRQRRAAAA